MTNASRLERRLGDGCTVETIEHNGRRYVVTHGTGENQFGSDGGGSAAFAYRASDLRAADLRKGGWDYSTWCNTISAVTDMSLAKALARRGIRLARPGACEAIMSDAEFARLSGGGL